MRKAYFVLVFSCQGKKIWIVKVEQGHAGIKWRKLCAWDTQRSKDILEFTGNCETCISFQNAQPAKPLLKHKISDQPLIKIGTDLVFDQ